MNPSAHQPPQIAHANGIDLCYEIFGDAGAEPMLLIMGLGAQMIHWDDDFCRQLAARGFRVIRFDNRDIGKSSKMSGGKRLTPLELLKLQGRPSVELAECDLDILAPCSEQGRIISTSSDLRNLIEQSLKSTECLLGAN